MCTVRVLSVVDWSLICIGRLDCWLIEDWFSMDVDGDLVRQAVGRSAIRASQKRFYE